METLNLRVERDILIEADAVTELVNNEPRFAWDKRTRADTLRTAIRIGLAALRDEHTPAPPKPAKRQPKRKRQHRPVAK